MRKDCKHFSRIGDVCWACDHKDEQEQRSDRITFLETENKRLRDWIKRLDDWQGQQSCYGSVYTIEDDEFGTMQSIIHEALSGEGSE